jgi:hypothetical protein
MITQCLDHFFTIVPERNSHTCSCLLRERNVNKVWMPSLCNRLIPVKWALIFLKTEEKIKKIPPF